MSKNLLVSFSGGETSAFMTKWLSYNYKKYNYKNIVCVFANTGLENEQTLEFVDKCEKNFGIKIYWIEAKTIFEYRKGTEYILTDYINASREGEPFENMIKKYGIPNQANPQCTRELKAIPIYKFGKDYFNNEKYDTAIGIRIDEADRISANYKERRFIYPLIFKDMNPTTKPKINDYWANMPFRLNLKGYQGNCVTCWKKSDKKLFQIAKENEKSFDFMKRMEEKYGNYFPTQRIEKWKKEKKEIPTNITFFRNKRSAETMIELSKKWNGKIVDDANIYTYQYDLLGGETCEIWSECINEDTNREGGV